MSRTTDDETKAWPADPATPEPTLVEPEAEPEPDGTVSPAPEPTGPLAWTGPLVVAVLAAAAYIAYSIAQWHKYETPSWDLGIFTQLARRYSDFQAPIVTIKGEGFNLLGDHFHPLLVVLGPVYKVFPSPLTLLVLQDLLFAFSVYVVARQAVRVLGALEGVLVGAAYAVSFGLVEAVASQFHEIAFAVPLLALSLVAFVRERWWACALWAAPLVFVKEDLGLTVAALGLVLWWRSRQRVGLWLTAWGAGWVVLATAVLVPLLNPSDQWDYSGRIDVRALVSQPWTAVTMLFDDGAKLGTLVMLVAITGLIGLRSPLMLVAVPTILWRFWATNEFYWGHQWHYGAILMPIAFAALLDGVLLARRSPRPWLRRYAMAAGSVAVVVAVTFVPQGPLGKLAKPDFWAGSTRAAEAAAVLGAIPDDATVETDIGLMSNLAPRTQVYYVGNTGNPAPDYVLIDNWGGGWSSPIDDVAAYAEQQHPGDSYEVVSNAGGYALAKRVP